MCSRVASYRCLKRPACAIVVAHVQACLTYVSSMSYMSYIYIYIVDCYYRFVKHNKVVEQGRSHTIPVNQIIQITITFLCI